MELTDEVKAKIDGMTHFELCRLWRFGGLGNPLLMDGSGEYVKERLFGHFGGFTPEISKQLGWD